MESNIYYRIGIGIIFLMLCYDSNEWCKEKANVLVPGTFLNGFVAIVLTLVITMWLVFKKFCGTVFEVLKIVIMFILYLFANIKAFVIILFWPLFRLIPKYRDYEP